MPINGIKEDEILNEGVNIRIINRLFSYLKPYKVQVVQTLLLMVIVVTVELLNPYFLKLSIDKYIKNGDKLGLLFLGAIMVGMNILSTICSRQRITKMSQVSNNILLTIRQQLFIHIQNLSFKFFDNRPIGKILARIIGDVNSLNDLFVNGVTSLIPDMIKITSVAIIMLCMNYRLAIGALVTLPALIVTLSLIMTVSRSRWQIYRKKASNINAFTHEAFSGMRVVQSFTAQKDTSKTFWELLIAQRNSFLDAIRMNDMFWPSVEVSWGVGAVVVFWYGMTLVNTGTITVGLLVAFIGYISMFWQPIMNISNFYNQLVTNMSGAERIFEILDISPDIVDKPNAIDLRKIKGNVSFNNISFGYEKNGQTLDNISFNVRAGEAVALVGPTGAGKTTIVSLISRFYEPTRGKILIDGIDIANVTLESLRSQVGVMPQDTFLFSGSIKENIRYGKLDATDEEIIRAANAVNAHDFIMRFENGYDTVVNERGSKLSMGQRQLIAFARVLLANPRILILDEATASIDTHTERLVQEGIKKLLSGRTSFVIAHRLSTIQTADRIMVIDKGKVVEIGSHEELMNCDGLYKDLFMAQFKFLNRAIS